MLPVKPTFIDLITSLLSSSKSTLPEPLQVHFVEGSPSLAKLAFPVYEVPAQESSHDELAVVGTRFEVSSNDSV